MSPLLVIHVAGGTIGLVTGTIALGAAKGERLHRWSGTLFFGSMLAMAATATWLAAGERKFGLLIGGVLTLYLIATAWMTARRAEGTTGIFEIGAAFVALVSAVALGFMGLDALYNPSNALAGVPLPAYFANAAIAALAGVFDLKVVLAGGISGTARIARHLWRMCVALLFATGSFFTNALPRILPPSLHAALHAMPVVYFLPMLVPLALMLYWLIRVRSPRFAAA